MPVDVVSDQFEQAFGQAEVVLVVDEWKGSLFESGPIIVAARIFDKAQPWVPRLYRLLATNRADEWHASGQRGQQSFCSIPQRSKE